MILAAGRGTRMGALTAGKPKPLLELDGETLIERHLRRLSERGFHDVVINLSLRGERIRRIVGDGSRYGLRVHYSEEPDEPLETAGGIIQALPLLGDEPFLILNADVVSDIEFGELSLNEGSGLLVMVPNPAHNPAGDYGIDTQSVLTLAEPRFTYAGISVLSPDLFADLAPGRRPLSQIFDRAIAEGELYGLLHEGLWVDVGTPERLEMARAALAGR